MTDETSYITCKCCGGQSMRDYVLQTEIDTKDPERVSHHFFICSVCEESYVARKVDLDDGGARIVYTHDPFRSNSVLDFGRVRDRQPPMIRVAHLGQNVVFSENAIDEWEYIMPAIDGSTIKIDPESWLERFNSRRRIRKSVACN